MGTRSEAQDILNKISDGLRIPVDIEEEEDDILIFSDGIQGSCFDAILTVGELYQERPSGTRRDTQLWPHQRIRRLATMTHSALLAGCLFH